LALFGLFGLFGPFWPFFRSFWVFLGLLVILGFIESLWLLRLLSSLWLPCLLMLFKIVTINILYTYSFLVALLLVRWFGGKGPEKGSGIGQEKTWSEEPQNR